MADREQTLRQFTKRRKAIKLHKELRQDPKYRSNIEKAIRERKRILEERECEKEIRDYIEN